MTEMIPLSRPCPECNGLRVRTHQLFKTGFRCDGIWFDVEKEIDVSKCLDCGEVGLPQSSLDELPAAVKQMGDV